MKFLSVLLITFCFVIAQDKYTTNDDCLRCHSMATLSVMNEHKSLIRDLSVNPKEYAESSHKNMSCSDCHEAEFSIFPHGKSNKKLSCLDCHEESETGFSFLRIKEEFNRSVHAQKMNGEFTCFSCHDPHSFKLNARLSDNIKNTVKYDNHICLKCHQHDNLLPKQIRGINELHSFLPHQDKHWKSVRCIDCHTSPSANGISHKINGKELAVKNCTECHSGDSRLLQTLYKFQKSKEREEKGFINSIILNNSYVIGATRNYLFNIISVILFLLTLTGISVHGFLRWKAGRKKSDE